MADPSMTRWPSMMARRAFGASDQTCMLNFSGGSAWNSAHLKLGIYEYWTSSGGKLYIKGGVPANDTDGTIVGTQT